MGGWKNGRMEEWKDVFVAWEMNGHLHDCVTK